MASTVLLSKPIRSLVDVFLADADHEPAEDIVVGRAEELGEQQTEKGNRQEPVLLLGLVVAMQWCHVEWWRGGLDHEGGTRKVRTTRQAGWSDRGHIVPRAAGSCRVESAWRAGRRSRPGNGILGRQAPR